MGRYKALVKKAYGEHFDKLRQIAEQVEELRQISSLVTDSGVKQSIETHISALENDLKKYAKNLETRGVELFENVA